MHRVPAFAGEYRPLFEQVWGAGSFDIDFPPETETSAHTPGGAAMFGGSATPIPLSPETAPAQHGL